MKLRARRSILWRLYVVGVVQLALVVSSAIAIGMVMMRLSDRWDPPRVVERLKPLVTHTDALARELLALGSRRKLQLSLYAEGGKLVASNMQPPLPMPPWSSDERPGELWLWAPHGSSPPHKPPSVSAPPHRSSGRPVPPVLYTQFEAGDRRFVLAMRADHRGPGPMPVVLTFVCGLLIVGAGAFLIRRWFAEPLAALSLAARTFGGGNLQARADLSRADEIGEVARAFNDMADRIQQLVLAEKELLANVSHELRTPLARIRVVLGIAVEGDAAAARASLTEITRDLAELETLLDDVLSAAQLAMDDGTSIAPSYALHLEEATVQALVGAAVQRFQSRNGQRPLQLTVESPATVLRVDSMLFRRVLENLLENAHKYSPDPRSAIELRAAHAGSAVVFEVIDRGIGIATEDIPHIFTAFFRSERSRSRGGGGVGLGLTLAKRIVEAHGGTIAVRSEIGAGTTVRVALPLETPSPTSRGPQ